VVTFDAPSAMGGRAMAGDGLQNLREGAGAARALMGAGLNVPYFQRASRGEQDNLGEPLGRGILPVEAKIQHPKFARCP